MNYFVEGLQGSGKSTLVRKLSEKNPEYRILYLQSDDVAANIDIIRKERSDDQGNELWFPLMLGYFNESPYARKLGVSGEEALLSHLRHRQELELEICREIFSDKVKILPSKKWNSDEL